MAATPPGASMARKSISASPSSMIPIVPGLGSPASMQKRKRWTDNGSLPGNASEGALIASQTLPKRQKYTEKTDERQPQHISMPASPLRNQTSPQTPLVMPSRPSQLQQINTPGIQDASQLIFITALQRNADLRQPDPTKVPIVSMRVDSIAHAMWDVVFENEHWMKDVTTKAAMLPLIKLRALARLNYLPSWWVLRELARTFIVRQRWILDDSDMQLLWNNTVDWCKRIEMKVGMHSDSFTPLNQGVAQGLPARQQAMKADF